MKSLIWKELREMGLWAAIIAVGLALAQGFALYMTLGVHGQDYTYNVSNEIDTIYGYFKLWMQVGAPIAGFVLGLLQIVPEQRRDQWAFLMHRPVTPRTIFFAKATAGIFLYVCATGLPLAGFSIWLSVPGNFPGPFDASLTLPDVAAILAGIPFYFAAMLVALRPARWWGSKILPVACAVTCTLFTVVAIEFIYAVMVVIAYIAAMLVAACGSFVSSGEYEGQLVWQRFCLGLTLLVGATATVVAAGAVVNGIASSFKPVVYTMSPSFALDKQDRLMQVEMSRYDGVKRVFDAEGRPAPGASTKSDDYDYGSGPSMTIGRSEYYPSDYGSYENHYSVVTDYSGDNHRYDIYDTRNRVIDAFSNIDHRLVGYIGIRGAVSPTILSAGPFPERALAPMIGEVDQVKTLMLFPSAVYALDDHEQSVSLFATPPRGSVFTGASIVRSTSGLEAVDNYVIALSGKTVSVYSAGGSTVATFPYIEPSTDYSSATVWMRPNPIRLFMLYESGYGASVEYYRQHPWRFVTVVPPGNVVADTPAYPMNVYSGGQQSGAAGMAGMIVMPAAVFAFFFAFSAVLAAIRTSGWQSIGVEIHDPNFGWILMWIAIGAAISALVVLALSRRYGWSNREKARWVIGGALLSWPGILMLLAMVPFPQRIDCPSCGKRRMVARTTCEHCGAAMPEPERDGTEIFESVESLELEEAPVASR
jgi:hypothetical protein